MSTVAYPIGAPLVRKNPPIAELLLEGGSSAPVVAVYKAEFLAPQNRMRFFLHGELFMTIFLQCGTLRRRRGIMLSLRHHMYIGDYAIFFLQ